MAVENYEEIKARVEELIAIPHCAEELKDAGKAWLDALGTDAQNCAAQALVAELEEDVMPIDATVAFFESETALNKFGAEIAGKLHDEACKAKEAGEAICTCAACRAGAEVLKLKELLEKKEI